jgi:hypothetical protein
MTTTEAAALTLSLRPLLSQGFCNNLCEWPTLNGVTVARLLYHTTNDQIIDIYATTDLAADITGLAEKADAAAVGAPVGSPTIQLWCARYQVVREK